MPKEEEQTKPALWGAAEPSPLVEEAEGKVEASQATAMKMRGNMMPVPVCRNST